MKPSLLNVAIPRECYAGVVQAVLLQDGDVSSLLDRPREEMDGLLSTGQVTGMVHRLATERGPEFLGPRGKENVTLLVESLPDLQATRGVRIMETLGTLGLTDVLERLERGKVADVLDWGALGVAGIDDPEIGTIYLRHGYTMAVPLPEGKTGRVPYVTRGGRQFSHLLATRDGLLNVDDYNAESPGRMEMEKYGPWLLEYWGRIDRSGKSSEILIRNGANPWVKPPGGQPYAQEVVHARMSLLRFYKVGQSQGLTLTDPVPGLVNEKPKTYLQYVFDRMAGQKIPPTHKHDLQELVRLGANPNQAGHTLAETLEPWLLQFDGVECRDKVATTRNMLHWVGTAMTLGMRVPNDGTQGKPRWKAWDTFYQGVKASRIEPAWLERENLRLRRCVTVTPEQSAMEVDLELA